MFSMLHSLLIAHLLIAAVTYGVAGRLAVTLARDAPMERDLPVILTSPQILVEARYLGPNAPGEFGRHAVCRCGLPLDGPVPQVLKDALIAQEDIRFNIHRGIDWIGVGRALVSNLSDGPLQGGSTLTQQLVKNLITGNARAGLSGIERKIREAIIARRVERAMTKEQILAAYFNQMDFGSTDGSAAIGIVQAASKYFGKRVKDLTLYEAAMLVGTLRATHAYNPIANPEAAAHRARAVLERMRNQGLISDDAFRRAARQAVKRGSPASIGIPAGYYVAWSRTELVQIAAAHAESGMVRYVVGLDTWNQVRGAAAVRDAVAHNADRHVGQGALVSLDRDGRVSALVGGADFAASQFDRATQAMRQPGSAFKLFVYTAAIEKGLQPATTRLDAAFSDDGWTPDNADHEFLGPITLTKAFALSRNTVAARLGREVGTKAVASMAQRLGIKSSLGSDPSLVLGTSEVTLMELTSAYVPFANDGRPVRPYAARLALDSSGRVFYRHDPAPQPPAVSKRTVEAMRAMLRAVVTDGTGQAARLAGHWSAGKTGTSQGNRDAWFIGFNDRLTTGIWFGNDDNSQMTGASGAATAAPAWRKYNEAINPAGEAEPHPVARPKAPGSQNPGGNGKQRSPKQAMHSRELIK